MRRGDREVPVEVAPREVDGTPRLGIMTGYGFDLPFEVTLDVDPAIGGSSAGMMFALSVYDTLTPGSLTGGEVIAGTGTVDDQGQVGPIGGIAQKIAAARDEGARALPGAAGQLRGGARRRPRRHAARPGRHREVGPGLAGALGRGPGRRPAPL